MTTPTLEELLELQRLEGELADRRVEALRAAAAIGNARQFIEREAKRIDDDYQAAHTFTEGVRKKYRAARTPRQIDPD